MPSMHLVWVGERCNDVLGRGLSCFGVKEDLKGERTVALDALWARSSYIDLQEQTQLFHSCLAGVGCCGWLRRLTVTMSRTCVFAHVMRESA